MGSFFSQVDNNNDKSGIYYSGVIGKLTPISYEYVIRFNLYEDKKACLLTDIFETPNQPAVEVPSEWLDKVEVPAYAGPKGWQGPNRNGAVVDYKTWIQEQNGHRKGKSWKDSEGTSNQLPKGMTSMWENQEALARSRRAIPEVTSPQNTRPRVDRDEEESEYLWAGAGVGSTEALGCDSRSVPNDVTGNPSQLEAYLSRLDAKGYSPMEEYMFSMGISQLTEEEIQEADAHTAAFVVAPSPLEEEEYEDTNLLGGEYEYYLEKYSVNIAEAKDTIDTELSELGTCDEALVDIIRQSYELLGSKGREELATNGF